MRRLIESGALHGDRFLQLGLRGYWPEPETLASMARQGIRSYKMTEIGARAWAMRSLPAEAVEFPVPHAAEKGMPLIRRELQDRPSGVPAVANADLATRQAGHFDAVAVGITQGALDPVRT